MDSLQKNTYSNTIRILICLLLLTSNSGGMVLCVDAQGRVEVKPAIHHKHHHESKGGTHCLAHTHHHLHSRKTTGIRGNPQTDDKIKFVTEAMKNCNDISIFIAQIDSKPIQTITVFIPTGYFETTCDLVDSFTGIETNMSYHFSGFPDPPLGMLRTVILLT